MAYAGMLKRCNFAYFLLQAKEFGEAGIVVAWMR
jgi:hypothetical protein